MQKNYSTVPFKTFYCSQNYDGQYSHYTQSHSTNGVKSYPIDVVDDIYCGCDEMKCLKINGVGNGAVNQLFVASTKPVIMPDGSQDYITYLITHPNDSDITANAWIGKTYKRGDFIIHKGTDGGVGAHIDLVIGKGQLTWWVQNSYGEWVLPNSIKPESGMYIEKSFTNVTNANGISFKELPADAYLTVPKPVERNIEVNQVEVICGTNTLRVRTGHSTNSKIIGFANPGVYNIVSTYEDGTYNWYEVEPGKWIASAEGCTRYLPMEEPKEEPEVIPEPVEEPVPEEKPEEENKEEKEDKKMTILKTIIDWIITLIKRIKK